MLRGFKTEIRPTWEQAKKIRQDVGTCRWLQNNYIAKNQELYEAFRSGELAKEEQHFLYDGDFDKLVNHEIKTQDDFSWVGECGSKARRAAEKNACEAFKKFFKGEGGYPKFRSKGKNDPSLYFPKNNKGDWEIERHRVKIPTFGWVRLKEFGYLPVGAGVVSGNVSFRNGRYFVSVLCDVEVQKLDAPKTAGIGVDMGLKATAVTSDGEVFPNINNGRKLRRLKKRERRKRRAFSRKCLAAKNGVPQDNFVPPVDGDGKRVATAASKLKREIKLAKALGGSANLQNKRKANKEVRACAKEQKRKAQQEAAEKAVAEAKAKGLPLPKKINGKTTRTTINGYKKTAKQKREEFKKLPKEEQRRIKAEREAAKAEARKREKAEAAEKRKAGGQKPKAFQKPGGQKKRSAGFYRDLDAIRSLNRRMTNIREDYQNKIVSRLVKRNPEYIAIEDLNVKGLMKDKHLAKALGEQRLGTLRVKIEGKCQIYGIDCRIIDRFYASTKECHNCKALKKEMPLSKRVYDCEVCGCHEDRDLNAALNLRDTDKFLLYDEFVRRRKNGTLARLARKRRSSAVRKAKARAKPAGETEAGAGKNAEAWKKPAGAKGNNAGASVTKPKPKSPALEASA